MSEHQARENLNLQSEHHPIVITAPRSIEEVCTSLVHRKAYETASGYAAGAAVLDVGCNVGYGSAMMVQSAKSVVGVDVSSASISAAKTQFGDLDIEFIQVDGETLPFGDDQFDLVTSFQVIEHVENVPAYLAEIVRVLKPGGTTIFTTPNRLVRLDEGMRPWNRFHVREYDADQLANAVRTGFSKTSVKGLFANPEVYDVEFARHDRARRKARNRGRRVALNVFSNILPEWMQNLARSTRARARKLRRPRDSEQEVRDFSDRVSLDDLFYRDEGLETALDLLAVCQK